MIFILIMIYDILSNILIVLNCSGVQEAIAPPNANVLPKIESPYELQIFLSSNN